MRATHLRTATVAVHVAFGVPALAALAAHSVPGVDTSLARLATVALAVVGAAWAVLAVAVVRLRGDARWLVLAPVGTALVLGLVVTDVPLRLRWELSKGEFERIAARLREGEGTPDVVDQRVGSYEIPWASLDDDGRVIFQEATGYGDGYAGFAYEPDGQSGGEPVRKLRPFDPSHTGRRALGGGWYAWTEW